MNKKVKNWIKEDQKKIISFLSEIVSCHNTENIEDTREPMNLVKNFLKNENIDFKDITHTKIMPNIISSINETSNGKHLMLNGHLDVLPIGNINEWKNPPFSGLISDGKIFGRGSADMKAGVVAMLFAYRYVNRLKESITGKLSLSIVSDEESGYGRGTGYLFKKVPDLMKCDGVLLAEPTPSEGIVISSKGYTQFSIKVTSPGAITGYDNISKNPILDAINIINEIKKLEDLNIQLPDELIKLFGKKNYSTWYDKHFGFDMTKQISKLSFDISEFHSGDSPIMLPNEVTFTVMMVSPVNANRTNILARVRRIVKKYPSATMSVLGGDDGEYSSYNTSLFNCLKNNIYNIYNIIVKPAPEVAISDARYWRYLDIPAYWYGLNGTNVGLANEFIVIDDLLSLIEIYTATILDYLH